MCGIVAIYGDKASEWASHMDTMLDRMSHRGPDDQGICVGGNIAMGQKRLSIIDVAGGRQPIFSEDRQKFVICNGEIYNYGALSDELHQHHFRTKSDTEAILHLFEEEGEGAVSRLDGMFTFVLYDGKDILVARDPLGIKPLYEGHKDDCVFFASELKALEGMVGSIQELPPGHYYSSKKGLVQYYHIPQVANYDKDMDIIIAMLRQRLTEAVRKRLMSDVPLCVFLSGGIDSSIMAAIGRKYFDRLNSFSVGIAGSTDLIYARKVADFLDTDHHELIYTLDDVLEVLPLVIYHLESFDPALVRSAISTYIVSRLAKDYVKVILTGEGSDEVFAGYHYFKEIDRKEALHKESIRILSGLHNLNPQRVDRATMAHSIEGRVPFLDIDFVEQALAIDPSLKLAGEERIEKWLLRKAFTGYLPEEVLWRTKMEFADGCGSAQLVGEFAENEISDAEFEEQKEVFKDVSILSKEELYYFKLFRGFFGTGGLHRVVGRWRGRFVSS
jgi:asparagine synthase (glutamine-hydrolysing)